MHALVFRDDGEVEVRSVAIPSPGAGELVVRVDAVGLCGSDLAAIGPDRSIETTAGAALGHEISGTVVRIGAMAPDRTGQRVVVHPNISCGACRYCTDGRPNLCPDQHTLGIHRDGGAAEYVVVPTAQVHPIPEGLDPVLAALAEPLACVLNGVAKARPGVGESAVVLGAGPIGLLYCAVLASMGLSPVIVSEPGAFRANLARGVGATRVVDPGDDDLTRCVRDATGGLGADVVVDAVGGLIGPALEVAAPGARIVIFGAHPGPDAFDPLIVLYREITISGVFTALHTFPRAVRFIDEHRSLLSPLVTHRFPLAQHADAFALLRGANAGKVVLLPNTA